MKNFIILITLLLAGLGSYSQNVASPTEIVVQLHPTLGMSDSTTAIAFVKLADAAQTGTIHIRVGSANGLGDIFSGEFALDGSSALAWNQHLRHTGDRVLIQLGFLATQSISQRPLYIDARVENASGSFSAATSTVVQ